MVLYLIGNLYDAKKDAKNFCDLSFYETGMNIETKDR